MTNDNYKEKVPAGNVEFYDRYDKRWSELTPEEIVKVARQVESHVDYRYWPIFAYLIDFYDREMFV